MNQENAPLPSGVYRHKETGEELVTVATSKFGNPQASAALRLGFEYVGPAKGEDKKALDAIVDPNAAPLASPSGMPSVEDLRAQLAEAEAREAAAKDRRVEADKVNALAEKQMDDTSAEKATDAKTGSKKGDK